MNKHILCFILAVTLLSSLPVYAEERACCYEQSNWYAGVSTMAVLPNQVSLDEGVPVFGHQSYDLKTGFGFSGLIGYQFFPNASVEIEIIGQQSEMDSTTVPPKPGSSGTKGTQSNKGVMFNHRWIYRNIGSIAPYIAAGAGVMNINAPIAYVVSVGPSEEEHRLKDTVMAYQFMAGVNFAVPNSKFEFYAGYRYIGTGQAEVKYHIISGYSKKFDASSHNIEIGGRIRF